MTYSNRNKMDKYRKSVNMYYMGNLMQTMTLLKKKLLEKMFQIYSATTAKSLLLTGIFNPPKSVFISDEDK